MAAAFLMLIFAINNINQPRMKDKYKIMAMNYKTMHDNNIRAYHKFILLSII